MRTEERWLEMESRLRVLRYFFGMDQTEMARWFDTNQPVISLWESGKRKPPLRQVATRFGVSIDWLEGLASRQWSERVCLLGKAYRERLSNVDGAEWVALVKAAPASRVYHAYQFLHEQAPDLVTPAYFTRLLGLSPDDFAALSSGALDLSREAFERLADFVVLSVDWFTLGDPSSLQHATVDQCYDLIRQLVHEGITPEEVRLIREVIKAIR